MEDKIQVLDHEQQGFQSRYTDVLNWIHQTVDPSQLKNELITYARSKKNTDISDLVSGSLVGVECKIAYCLNRGAKLSNSSVSRLETLIDKIADRCSQASPEWEYLPETPSSKIVRAYVGCYSHIDNAKTRVLRGILDQRDLATEVRKIVQTYAQSKTAVVKQLAEHYKEAYLEARQEDAIRDWIKPLATISDTLHLMLSNRASIRAGARGAKARKMQSTVETMDRKGEKAASRVSYKDEDNTLGIRSVDPTNIVGAAAAVVFNTKTRHCEVYLAEKDKTLSVQGAKIINFDEKASMGRTLRKPESDLPHWVRATTLRRLEVLATGIKGKVWEVNGKLNKNCIIVKVL